MDASRYVARCRRVDGWWAVDVYDDQGLPVRGAHTQARRLDEVQRMVKEVVSMLQDVPEDEVAVRVEPEMPDDVRTEVERAQRLREVAETAQREAAEATSRAASELVNRGRFTVRDAGGILGLSHQRINQLVKGRRSG
jgi:hypothetical protein